MRGSDDDELSPVLAARARAIMARRARRDRVFGAASQLFGDPVWSLLLDLYVNAAAGRRVSVSSACIVTGVPMSTALRWLGRMEEAGLIRRVPDAVDARRAFIMLTSAALTAMESVLAAGEKLS